MIALAGAEVSFGRAAGLLAAPAGITVSARTIGRSAEAAGWPPGPPPKPGPPPSWPARSSRCPRPCRSPACCMEAGGSGVAVAASETEGRQGKDGDGQAGTREVKLARLFTVSRLDDDGRPVMDPGSSTCVAAFGGKDALARLVQAGYLRHRGEHVRQVVAFGGGAAWIWAMAGDLYRQATHITDICHAREHLNGLAARLAFITPGPAQWLEDRNTGLGAGDIQAIIGAARACPLDCIKASDLERKLGYFRSNAHRMRCADFRKPGVFTGSGAIEGGIKSVVQRARQSGMHWAVAGAGDVIFLRCHHASGRWNELWPARSSTLQPAARRHLEDSSTQACRQHRWA
jgi:hypothetical protein